ncbi:TIGR02302 family protein [Acuticoccus sp. M5D2P5]|uniref:TIGR02302 family protein n=1 Tax=Acuticoccus kalidii TaxID=2910977 RepID=UPI001F2E93FA|nr:TIGR02302 family protein [Acuticoccus kalidii]MCF3932779.1 TIGR02302 family protein [Acuticoccus kalidii]
MTLPLNRRLSRLILSARAALAWERLWPAVAPMVGVVVVFVASAWMGLWVGLPSLAKVIGLTLFAVAFLAAGWRLRRLKMPGRDEAVRRLETDAALDHRPLDTYEDALTPGSDAFAASLWRVHRERAEARLKALRIPIPRADLVPHDPYALRSAVGIIAFIGILVGAGALAERLITPFDFSDPVETASGPQFRLDAWVTPPAYTGRQPLFLSAATRVDTGNGIRVPAGSKLTVRSQGVTGIDLLVSDKDGAREEALAPIGEGTAGEVARAHESVVTIDGPMAVEVRRDGTTVDGWQFVADGDSPPTVAFIEPPAADQRDGFEVRYELGDDYGIASARGIVTPESAPNDRRPLVEDPAFALTLPGGAGMRGAARTVQDLSQHPYAGQEVRLVLEATDGVGQTGYSRPERFRLPARTFVNPMARAIVEQRTILAMDARAQARVIDAMDLLLLTPEEIGSPGAFLATKAAYRDLVAADTDDELREMLDQLWDLALMLEDDGLSDAERALQAAQERLRQAIEDGAPPEEIARLTQELREAMQRYMQALAERMQNMPQQQMDPNATELTQQNLDDLLNRIQELANQGRTEEAESLLAELQQMMQNLQMAQGGQGQQQGDPMGQNGRALDELGKMIQRQQELMDETYGMNENGRQGEGRGQPMDPFGNPLSRNFPPQLGQPGQQQGQRGEGQNGQQGGQQMSPDERAEAMRRLQQQQSELREQLDEMMRRLEEQGFEPGEQFGDAGQSMGEAGEALGQDQAGRAVDDQSDALQALRDGARDMAQQMAEAQQQQQGGDSGEDVGAPRQGPGADPLGRARREGTYTDTSRVGIPDEIETQRARRILQELRKRLGDRAIPRLERDYLERLLPQ